MKNIRENLFIEAKTLQKELDKQSEKENIIKIVYQLELSKH
ncbi:hypothetical protein QK911_11265 [Lactococcus lactis]